MVAQRLHLVRHGEVDNPQQILYGRLPNYRLSSAGVQMAQSAAEHLAGSGRIVAALRCSPLQRTQESARPFTEQWAQAPVLDERVIEPWNVFEGTQMRRALRNPLNWRHLIRPSQPSWGEPYLSIADRMLDAMNDAWESTPDDDVVIVSHQAPIWIAHLAVAGLKFQHDPRSRRCALSSITSFERSDAGWQEVDYAEPAAGAGAVDVGAV